jgi:hypothetical protein
VLLSPKAETALKTRHNYANYFCWWEELLCPIPEWFVGAMPERLTTNEHEWTQIQRKAGLPANNAN